MRPKQVIFSAAALATISGFGVFAKQQPSDMNMPDVLMEPLREGVTIEQYVARLAGVVRNADNSGDGLDQQDISAERDQQRARERANAINRVLINDLDGDLKVTRRELEQSFRTEEPYRSRQVEAQLATFDANGDGTITVEEAAGSIAPRYNNQLGQLLALDSNGDGQLTAEELRRRAEAAFTKIDSDRDGKISATEYASIGGRTPQIRVSQPTPVCSLPPIPQKAKLVLFGGYEGDTISSAVVGGPEQETNLIDVTIEPGSSPLYLVLTSYESMIWRFSGSTNRIARVVVSSSASARPMLTLDKPATAEHAKPGENREAPIMPWSEHYRNKTSATGVVGLPASKVAITNPGCPGYFYDVEKSNSAVASLRNTLGRDPDAIFGNYSSRRLSLPSGDVVTTDRRQSSPPPAGFDAETWREAVRFWPGGLAHVDFRKVVAAAKVEPYEVLPSQMGLSQLVGSGAAKRLSRDTYRILRPIAHMPPSMGGAHSATLIFAKGITLPPGDPVHSCIVSEDGGQPTGARCNIDRDR